MKKRSPLTGAIFLMATSAIGPGFLTQTTVFTRDLLTSFGFVILIAIFLDIGAQINIWRIVAGSRMPAQDIANRTFKGSGTLLALLIAFGGLAFNVGNIAGTGLGLQAITGVDPLYGAVFGSVVAIIVFWTRNSSNVIDLFTKILGILMILVTAAMAVSSSPPVTQALMHTVVPQKVDLLKIVTIVGGTVGGYISFAGAHRLLESDAEQLNDLRRITSSSIKGILLTSLMRYVLFLAVLGVVAQGVMLSPVNPVSTVFELAGGRWGLLFFGIVMWSASITSVIGASFTSISFLKTLHPLVEKYQKSMVTVFIVISCVIFLVTRTPVRLLLVAGAINGLILPLSLSILLIASGRLQHAAVTSPLWLRFAGWSVVLIMLLMSFYSIGNLLL